LKKKKKIPPFADRHQIEDTPPIRYSDSTSVLIALGRAKNSNRDSERDRQKFVISPMAEE